MAVALIAEYIRPRWERAALVILLAVLLATNAATLGTFLREVAFNAVVFAAAWFGVKHILRFNVLGYFLLAAMTVLIPDPPDPDNLAARLRAAPGLLLVADDEGSAGVVDAVGHEAILVRLRKQPAGASIWCAFDSARLAALDAVWVAEKLSGMASPGLA